MLLGFNAPGMSLSTMGGWFTHGYLALATEAHFLAVAGHTLIPARARNATQKVACQGFKVAVGASMTRYFSCGSCQLSLRGQLQSFSMQFATDSKLSPSFKNTTNFCFKTDDLQETCSLCDLAHLIFSSLTRTLWVFRGELRCNNTTCWW